MSAARRTEVSRIGPLLALAVTVLVLFFARDLLVLFAFALMLAFLLAPAVSRLEAARAPRVVAVAITGFLAFSIICAIGYVVARQLLNVARDLPAYRLNIAQKMASVHSPAEQSVAKAFTALEEIGEDLASSAGNTTVGVPQPALRIQPVRIVDTERSQLESATELLMRLVRPDRTLGVVIVFTIYLLMEREDLRRRILLLAGMSRIRLMNQALEDAASRISQYIFFQVAVNAGYGTLFGLGLFIGVPNATFWGALAGILRIVPYVGTATGLILPLVVCVATSASWCCSTAPDCDFSNPRGFGHERCGTVAVPLAYRHLCACTADHGHLLVASVGISWADPLHSTDGLHRGAGPQRAAVVFSPRPARRRCGTLRRSVVL